MKTSSLKGLWLFRNGRQRFLNTFKVRSDGLIDSSYIFSSCVSRLTPIVMALNAINCRMSLFSFLEWQPCHSSAKGYGFHQINHTIDLKARQYNCWIAEVPFFFLSTKKFHLYKRAGLLLSLVAFSNYSLILIPQ